VENGLVCSLHSDILTPLPALGVPFEIDDTKGPIIETPITSMDAVRDLHALDLSRLTFVGDALAALRQEVGDKARPHCWPPPESTRHRHMQLARTMPAGIRMYGEACSIASAQDA